MLLGPVQTQCMFPVEMQGSGGAEAGSHGLSLFEGSVLSFWGYLCGVLLCQCLCIAVRFSPEYQDFFFVPENAEH